MSSDTNNADQSKTPTTEGSDDVPESGEPPAPSPGPRPKRGAFPARQSQIDEANPYIPEIDETD
jgi:hypothetical protein